MAVDLTRWIATLSGLLATAGAALILTMLPADSPVGGKTETAPIATPEPPLVSVTTITPSTPAGPVAGIDPTVSRALATSGYTEFMGTTDLETLLPTSVVGALEEAEAVLVIPDLGDQ